MELLSSCGKTYIRLLKLVRVESTVSRVHDRLSLRLAGIMTSVTSAKASEDAVLITGGAGFLGQHVVKMFQEKADHVNEIRILDIKKYENKLGNNERVAVKQYFGSVTDMEIVKKAVRGVKSVIHIAGLISYGTFPDVEGMELVNVQGTKAIIDGCLQAGVERLVFCSTIDVVIGFEDIYGGDEKSTYKPETFLFPGYPETKFKAECMVLGANGMECGDGKILSTLALRANVMYGEGDPYYVTSALRSAQQAKGSLIRVGNGQAKFQQAYVGNAAWAFVCADKSLKFNRSLGGQTFYIPDDTTVQNTFQFMKPFLESRNFRLSPYSLPFYLVYWPLYVIENILQSLAPFKKVNMKTASCSLMYINMNLYFKGDKARRELGYYPLYSEEEAISKSIPYYKSAKL